MFFFKYLTFAHFTDFEHKLATFTSCFQNFKHSNNTQGKLKVKLSQILYSQHIRFMLKFEAQDGHFFPVSKSILRGFRILHCVSERLPFWRHVQPRFTAIF